MKNLFFNFLTWIQSKKEGFLIKKRSSLDKQFPKEWRERDFFHCREKIIKFPRQIRSLFFSVSWRITPEPLLFAGGGGTLIFSLSLSLFLGIQKSKKFTNLQNPFKKVKKSTLQSLDKIRAEQTESVFWVVSLVCYWPHLRNFSPLKGTLNISQGNFYNWFFVFSLNLTFNTPYSSLIELDSGRDINRTWIFSSNK